MMIDARTDARRNVRVGRALAHCDSPNADVASAVLARQISGFAAPALGVALSIALCVGAPGTVLAQSSPPIHPSANSDEPDNALAEIVVTAQRREQNLQEVPISINVLDAKALSEKYITNPGDLAQHSPGLSAVNFGINGNLAFSIHGQGQVGGTAPGVVTYVAEVPSNSIFMYDLSSVQVLKGPQGTLFGRNTTGGAVLLTPIKPTDDFNGYVTIRAGDYQRSDQEFAVGGAIVPDKLSLRIAGVSLSRAGYTRNLADGKYLNDENRQSFRASLLFRPMEGLENYTIFQYDRAVEEGNGFVFAGFDNAPTTPYVTELPAYLALQQSRGPRVIQTDWPQSVKLRKSTVINTTTWELADNFSVKNLLRYSTGGLVTGDDVDGSPYRIIQQKFSYRSQPNEKSEEFQLRFDSHEGLQAAVGVFYEKDDLGSLFDHVALTAVTPAGPFPTDLYLPTIGETKNKAVFAEGSWTFLQDWSLTMGYRHTKDETTTSTGQSVSVAGSPPAVTQPFTHYEGESQANTWNVAVDYKFTPDVMGYLSVRRGYKTGGINAAAAAPSLIPYEPEFVLDYSTGVKSEWTLGGWQMRANVDAYYDKYTDIQRSLVPPTSSIPIVVIQNAAKAKIWGLDLDLLLVPSRFFDVALQYALIKTKYDEFLAPPYGDLSDGKFPNTPKHQLSLTPSAHLPLPGDAGELAAQATLYYQSDTATTVNNVLNGAPLEDANVPFSIAPAYTRLDFRLAWNHMFGHPLTTSFYIRNLTDKDFRVGGQSLTSPGIGVASYIYGAPRMFNFEARYDF